MKDEKDKKEQLKPEDLKSGFVHEKIGIRDRMHTDYWDRENGVSMKHQDMEVLTKMWDELEHFSGGWYKNRGEK